MVTMLADELKSLQNGIAQRDNRVSFPRFRFWRSGQSQNCRR
jgi:hypothetical protein